MLSSAFGRRDRTPAAPGGGFAGGRSDASQQSPIFALPKKTSLSWALIAIRLLVLCCWDSYFSFIYIPVPRTVMSWKRSASILQIALLLSARCGKTLLRRLRRRRKTLLQPARL